MRVILFAIAPLLVSLCACGKSGAEGLTVGGLYSVKDEAGFKVVKILAQDGAGVHVRIYANKFPTRPDKIDPAKLTLGSIKDKDGFGMGHLPLDRDLFASWNPKFIAQATVSEEELDGYREWKKAKGGVFK